MAEMKDIGRDKWFCRLNNGKSMVAYQQGCGWRICVNKETCRYAAQIQQFVNKSRRDYLLVLW